MDKINQKILDALQEDGRLSLASLAKKVNLSAPAVAERVKRLEELKIIKQYFARLDPQQLGFQIEAIVRVRVFFGKERLFFKFAAAREEVTAAYNVTGEYAFILKVVVKTVQELDSFLEDVSQLGESKSSIVLSEVTRKPLKILK